MKLISEPIVFFGSGPVAAESLRLLADSFTIEAVITKPRPPHHKGDVPVLLLADQLGLPTYTVTSRKELDDLFSRKPVRSKLGILIDFGIIVSQDVIDYFSLGIINSHFSILPEWRGADPITFSILSGQEVTGVSIMLLTAGLDEGPLLSYGEQPMSAFPEPVTSPQLTDKLIKLSHSLLVHDIPPYIAGHTHGVPQETTGRGLSYSRKLSKSDGIIDWNKSAAVLEREIRAFIEWPKSRTSFNALDVVIMRAQVTQVSGQPGTRTIINKQPIIYCGTDALIIERIKPAGKKEMTGESFLAGYSSIFLQPS